MYDDLIYERLPPTNRVGTCDGDHEKHFSEAAIMLAFAMHLFGSFADIEEVRMHPDGMHGVGPFNIRAWLLRNGFEHKATHGATDYAGLYRHTDGRHLRISVQPGLGDVVAEGGKHKFFAECKGGIINTRHGGQLSRLRSGLYETIGHLIDHDRNGERLVAVVPRTPLTAKLAQRMDANLQKIGIEIALVDSNGTVALAS
jgi:hypothetical protein